MNFDSLMLAAVAHELQEALLGARVEKISQPAALEVVIHLYNNGRKRALFISLEPMAARIHMTTRARANPPKPPAFCMLLRKYLEGGWLEGVEHPFGYGERVVRLTFAGIEGRRFGLYAELMGKHSNLILVGEDRNILGAAKTIHADMSRFREIKPGMRYFAPPIIRGGKRDAYAADAGIGIEPAEFAGGEQAAQWLLAHFTGVSAFMAHEAVARAREPLTSESVWFGLNELLNAARTAEYTPIEFRLPGERLFQPYPVTLRSVPTANQRGVTYLNDALDAYYESAEVVDAFRRERDALHSALTRSLKACERELIDVAEGLANADRADEYKQTGDLLLANSSKVDGTSKSVTVTDYYDPSGGNRTIALDPKLNVHENAERYYKKHQKARDSFERLSARQSLLEDSLEELVRARERVAAALDIHELQQIAKNLSDDISAHLHYAGIDAEKATRPAADEGPKYEGFKVKRYQSVDGWEILVGETATSNDYLTTKLASPNDIWLHARSIPSAHAIVRSQNRPASVSTAALRLAAEHVARRSDAKHARLVPVDYTLKKYVRKPHGAAPGAVTYSHEKTLDVEPSEE